MIPEGKWLIGQYEKTKRQKTGLSNKVKLDMKINSSALITVLSDREMEYLSKMCLKAKIV